MADDISITDDSKAGDDRTIEFKEDKEVTKARHEIFIQEIEAMDDYWGSTFRTIYTKGEEEQFMKKLDERTREHDKNIERMCNFHYQGFIDSIRELLQVRTEASKLKHEVTGVNQELADASRHLLKHGDALCKARRVQSNIHEGIEALKGCLPVLETHVRLRKQMSDQRFYPALKTLETLENTMLPKVAGHKFAQVIAASVPAARASIQAAAMSDLKDFLEVVRRESPRIGEVAIRHADEQYGTDPSAEGRADTKRHTLAFLGEEPLAPETLYEVDGETEDERVAQELVNFSPVYRCLHIFTALGAKDTFRAYYVKQRQKQAGLALQPPAGMLDTLASLRDYLHGVAGFFVVEDHVLNTTTGLVTRAELDQLWASALAKLTAALQSHASCLTDANLLLTFKQLIMVFSHALRNYGFTVKPLHSLLLEVRDHYSEVLMQRWVAVFRDIFDKDNYHPVQVDTSREYEQILQVFPYSSDALEKTPLPRRFPFSLMVPKVYSQVKEFIHSCLCFSDGLNLSQSERDDMLRRSTNVLLTRTLAGCLTTLVRRPGLSLLQLIQVTINTIYLEQASVFLEDVITELTG